MDDVTWRRCTLRGRQQVVRSCTCGVALGMERPRIMCLRIGCEDRWDGFGGSVSAKGCVSGDICEGGEWGRVMVSNEGLAVGGGGCRESV